MGVQSRKPFGLFQQCCIISWTQLLTHFNDLMSFHTNLVKLIFSVPILLETQQH